MNSNDRKQRLAKRYTRDFSKGTPSGMGGPRPGRGPGGPGGRFGAKGGKPKNTSATIRRLFGYIAADKAKIVLAFVCVLLTAASTLAGSYMLRPIINNYIEHPDISGLAVALAVMSAVYLVGVVSSYVQSRIMIGISQRALCNIRGDLFHR